MCLVLLAAIIEPLVGEALPCQHRPTLSSDNGDDKNNNKSFPNPEYLDDVCYRTIRFYQLAFLTREECSFARRLVAAVVLGGIIGWERRQADRPAGIRTMALVSLASCLFTLGSAFAFRSGPQDWDASRISAAIPSGVGFLGAGLIFKQQQRGSSSGMPMVHGITTAASLWISAAVGIACGGEMYFCATFTCSILLLLLRFGPRYWEAPSEEDDDDGDDEEHGIDRDGNFGSSARVGGASNEKDKTSTEITQLISRKSGKKTSGRDVPQLL